jgi:TonB family protein
LEASVLKLERQAPDVSLGIAVLAHVIIVVAVIWNSSITIPGNAALMQHINEAESTIDIIMFADKVAGVVRSAASAAVKQAPLPKAPEFRIPELSEGDVVQFRPSSVLADNGALWAMPPITARDTATRVLDEHELADGPRFTPYTRAPNLRNRDDIQRYMKKHFPIALRRAGGEARAIVWLLVDRRGKVFKAVLHETSGRVDTDSVAVRASYQMEFDPAEQAGQAVPVWVQQPVRFRVEDIY